MQTGYRFGACRISPFSADAPFNGANHDLQLGVLGLILGAIYVPSHAKHWVPAAESSIEHGAACDCLSVVELLHFNKFMDFVREFQLIKSVQN